jgi:hypothetical protein
MTPVLALDPGPRFTAWAVWNGVKCDGAKWENDYLFRLVETTGMHLAIEWIACYGMAVGAEVFDTCRWVGRYEQAAKRPIQLVKRLQVKMHLCHSARANDSNIRQAIIDRFGGKAVAIGTKAAPGPLYGVAGDVWAALALALTVADKRDNACTLPPTIGPSLS